MRRPQFLKLTTSKTKQVCRTASIFQVGKIKNEASLRDILQKWNVECRADGLVPMRFSIFPLHLSKVLRLPRKSDARSYEGLHLSRKIISPGLAIWCSKMQPFPGNLRFDLLTHVPHVSLVLRLPRKMYLSRSSSNVSRLLSFLKLLWNCYKTQCFAHFWPGAQSPAPATQNDIWTSKSAQYLEFFTLLTPKCASRHDGVYFFNISTSKSALSVVCTCWLQNVLRATTVCTFSTSQLPKWSKNGVLFTFWLPNMLRVTTACNFSSLIWPHGSAPAALASLLFDPPEPQIIGTMKKHSVSQLSYLCARLDLLSSETFSLLIFFLLRFSFLALPISAFHLSILSEVWLLNFLRLSSIEYFSNITPQQPLFVMLIYFDEFGAVFGAMWPNAMNPLWIHFWGMNCTCLSIPSRVNWAYATGF